MVEEDNPLSVDRSIEVSHEGYSEDISKTNITCSSFIMLLVIVSIILLSLFVITK